MESRLIPPLRVCIHNIFFRYYFYVGSNFVYLPRSMNLSGFIVLEFAYINKDDMSRSSNVVKFKICLSTLLVYGYQDNHALMVTQ